MLIMGANISGSHFNPAVTLAFMFRKDEGRFRRLLGILYIAFQFLGGIVGALFSYNLLMARSSIGVAKVVIGTKTTWYWSQAMFAETLGSTILVFIYLSQTEKKTQLAKDPAITMLVISGAYICACVIARSGMVGISPINPAIASGILGAEILAGKYSYAWGWVLLAFPMVGAILGLLLFEFVYKKTHGAVKEGEGGDDDNKSSSSNGEPGYTA